MEGPRTEDLVLLTRKPLSQLAAPPALRLLGVVKEASSDQGVRLLQVPHSCRSSSSPLCIMAAQHHHHYHPCVSWLLLHYDSWFCQVCLGWEAEPRLVCR